MKGLRGWTAAISAFLLAAGLPASAAAAPGDLDTTFGGGSGKVITNVTDGYDWASGLVLQLGGEIITAGQASGSGGRFYLVRYLNDGSLDTSFGGGDGVVFTNFTPRADYGYEVTFDNNSRIVVVGGVGGSGGRFGLARYNLDGTPDTTFSDDGKVMTNFTPGNDYAFNVLIQDGNKIVAVGRAEGSGGRFAIARYNEDGSLDDTFGGDGKVMTNFTAGEDYIDDVINVGLGSFVVAGTANLGRDSKFALAQYDSTGQLVPSFGGDGKVTTNLTGGLDGAWGIANQGGVGYVATGPAGGRVGLVRYTSTGALDSTFGGGDGITRTDWSSGLDWSDEIALDVDGRIVIVGISNVSGNDPRYALGRYSAAGAFDFAKLTNLTGGLDYGLDVQIESSTQKIVTTGAVRNGRQSFVARHLGN